MKKPADNIAKHRRRGGDQPPPKTLAADIDWDECIARLHDIFDELDRKYPR